MPVCALEENTALNKIPTTNISKWYTVYYPIYLNNIVDNDWNTVSAGNADTYATANQLTPDLSYIQIDLQGTYNISAIYWKYQFSSGGGTGVNVNINVSQDGVTWNRIYQNSTTTDYLNPITNNESNISQQLCRYIRFNVWVPGGGAGYIRWYEIQAYGNLILYSPSNGSTIYLDYPELTKDVNFTWGYGAPTYNLKIAKDVNFNILVVDKIVSTSFSTESLEPATYWWKVRTYNTTSGYGEYSDLFTLNLIRNASSSGITGIEGFVYELSDGTPIPISHATIYIRKEALNWSDSTVTGSNGYYLFDNLTNSTVYSISAKAEGYEDSVTEYITTIPGQRINKNLILNKCISGFTCFYNQHYVQFTVQNIWFTKYAGVTATVYKGSELTASDTKITGTDGSVNILLIKDQQYRITFINATAGISTTWIGYPSKTEYYIITDATTSGWDTHGTDAATTTDIEVTTQTINDTHAYVNVSYNDTRAGTSNLMFYLNKTIAGDPNNQTNLQSINGGNNDQYNASFIVSGYGGNSYLVKVKADHSTYGTISYSYAVQFAQLPGPLANFDGTIILMLFVGLVLFVSGMFGQTSQVQGMAIIIGICWILAGIGIFSNVNAGAGFYLSLSLATIISIIANINERGRHEALQ